MTTTNGSRAWLLQAARSGAVIIRWSFRSTEAMGKIVRFPLLCEGNIPIGLSNVYCLTVKNPPCFVLAMVSSSSFCFIARFLVRFSFFASRLVCFLLYHHNSFCYLLLRALSILGGVAAWVGLHGEALGNDTKNEERLPNSRNVPLSEYRADEPADSNEQSVDRNGTKKTKQMSYCSQK